MINKEVKGTLHYSPINGDAATEFLFSPKTQAELGIQRDTLDHRKNVFILPVDNSFETLMSTEKSKPDGDFCWQWDVTVFLKEYEYGFGTEGGADVASAKLIRSKNLKKTCTWE